ncbi:hypothetical protein LCGC14_1075810 [marine sediment metagenome]|uniref:Uncharacterized protein n=1 Tax=marine sediment metagenome TaxID=412755 RepID=A0A0F9N462_9ZZZZ
MEFPTPQTLGRTRGINTVPTDPNAGLLARPTATEARSLWDQVRSYINNYGGSIGLTQTIKGIESQQKAAPIGNVTPSVFGTISGVLESARAVESTWKTIADKIIEDRGLVIQSDYPGAKVPGPIPAPRVENYGGANSMDKALSAIKRAGEEFVNQVKGMFNLGYDGPQDQTGVPIEEHKGLFRRDIGPKATAATLLLGILLLG